MHAGPNSTFVYYQGRIEPRKAARGHATHIDGIVLNVTKFRIQILCSLHCVISRSARTIEVLSAYTKCVHVEDRYQHFYGMGGLTCSTRTSIFSNTQHYMLSMLALLEVACSLAAFGGSMRP